MDTPVRLRRQVVLYALPLLMVSSHFPGINMLFVASIPSSLAALAVPSTKQRMYISNVLFVLFLLFPGTYFICYGFTVTTTYVSVAALCLDTFQKDNLRVCAAVESLGLFLSLHLLSSRAVSSVFAILQFAAIRYMVSPPIESVDYGEAYRKVVRLLGGASFVNKAGEYKKVVSSKGRDILEARIDFLVPLLVGRLSLFPKVVVCCSSLVANRKSYWLCFIVYFLSLFPLDWCCALFSFFCDFVPGHPTYRLAGIQALYLISR